MKGAYLPDYVLIANDLILNSKFDKAEEILKDKLDYCPFS